MIFLLGALFLLIGGCALVWVIQRHVASKPGSPYLPEAAETPDPVDAIHEQYQRASWFTDSTHPKDCVERCCIDARVAEFDWPAAENEMRSKR